jgi:hypothetical protein
MLLSEIEHLFVVLIDIGALVISGAVQEHR